MKRMLSPTTRPALIGLLLAFSLVLAACMPTVSGQNPASTSTATGNETVRIVDNSDFGQILVTADGMALYTNTVDSADDLRCVQTECTNFWPPYIVKGEFSASKDILSSLGTVTRPDGSKQLTFNQKPLYMFYLDTQPGDVKGEGFVDLGGTWHVATPGGSSGVSSPAPGSGYGGIQY